MAKDRNTALMLEGKKKQQRIFFNCMKFFSDVAF